MIVLIFSLMHQSSLLLSVSLGILSQKASVIIYRFTCLLFPVHPWLFDTPIHILIHITNTTQIICTCVLLPVSSSVSLHPLPSALLSLTTQAICLVIHPSIFKHLSHLNSSFLFLLLLKGFLSILLFPLYHTSFIYHSINLFMVTSFCHLALFLPFSLFFYVSLFLFSATSPSSRSSPPSHPELSYLAGVTAADVARTQTSASPVLLHLYSADQTNRFNSPKLAVLTAALMCSWAAWAESQLNMLQTQRTDWKAVLKKKKPLGMVGRYDKNKP